MDIIPARVLGPLSWGAVPSEAPVPSPSQWGCPTPLGLAQMGGFA